jgi:carboxyl-terminal processing protease
MDGAKYRVYGVSAALILGAFVGGVWIGNQNVVNVEEVTSLIHTERDVLTAQVGGNQEEFDFTPYWRVWNILERKFIPFGTTTAQQIPAEDRVYRSIEGLVASYDDPYTVFMRPQAASDFKIATQGSLEGIGAVIGERDGGLIVVGPLPDSPAEKAGLVAGDGILKIDGKEVQGLSVDEAVKYIRGERGTEVVLTVKTSTGEERDVSIVRGTIEIPSTAHAVIPREVPKLAVDDAKKDSNVSKGDTGSDTMGDKGDEPEVPQETEVKDFYVLRLFSFSRTSISAFERELKDFVASGSDSLIIDIRGNPGGFIDSAVEIASWFLSEGDVVVREFSGPNKKEVIHTAQNKKLFKDELPKIALLVDKGSASASEILAGALQEHGVATVVGTNTFGKGSVQELISISDELSLKVTVARWYTPNGVSISEGGLTPNVLIDLSTATSGDPWFDAAVETLSSS